MRASTSCNSRAHITSMNKRLTTIFKKAYELSVLCAIEVCVIYYGPEGRLKTWPSEAKVKDMALGYKTATKRTKSLNLHEFMEKEKEREKKKPKTNSKKKKKNLDGFKYPVWYPIFDHYSPNQLSQLNLSLEHTLSKLQDRLRFVEAEKQRKTNLVHQSLAPSSLNHHQYQTQPLNPNHGDATLAQLPFSASHYSQQLTNYQNHLMMMQQQQHYLQHPYVSNKQDYLALLSVQESLLKNQLMQQQQQELHGFDQNGVLQHPCISNTVPDVFCSDFQKNPYGGDMGNSYSQPQDYPNMFSSYDQSNLLQTSSLPSSLNTIPNTYCLPDNSRTL